jgi:hypothetical protein
MSLTNYKIFKISDKNVHLELQINSHNDQDFKCTVKFEQEINLDGFPPFIVKPICVCDTSNNKVSVTVDVPYEIIEKEEDVSFKLEDPFVRIDEYDYDTEEEEKKIVDEMTREIAQEVVEEVIQKVTEETKEEITEEIKEENKEETKEENKEENKEEKTKEENKEEKIGEETAEETKEEIAEKEEPNSRKELNDILSNFHKNIENLINRLDTLDTFDDKNKKKIHHAPKISIVEELNFNPLEFTHPPTPPQEERKPHPPTPQNKPHPPPTPPQEERKPHPPTPQNKPHPPPTPPQPTKPSKPGLNEKIAAIQKLYHSIDVQKNLTQIIIDHMRCIEQFHMTGEEKKKIVLNSIELILLNNEVTNIDFIISLSSQLIDVFVAFDKDKITIEQKASALACFACK